jgi:hypothetical protein
MDAVIAMEKSYIIKQSVIAMEKSYIMNHVYCDCNGIKLYPETWML